MKSTLVFENSQLHEITKQFQSHTNKNQNCFLDSVSVTGIVPFRNIHSIPLIGTCQIDKSKYQMCLLRLNGDQSDFFSKLETNLDTKLIRQIPNFCHKDLVISVLPVRISKSPDISPESDINRVAKIEFHIKKVDQDTVKIIPHLLEIVSKTSQRKTIPFGRKLPARD